MMKKYFTDGLIQIAVALSLLRTDLNDYVNIMINDYSQERNGIHEVLLGSGTSAFTQTDLYSNNWYNDLSTSVHPKNIDNYIASSVFRDLHSLGDYRNIINTDIDAYLVGETGDELPESNQPHNADHHSNTNSNDEETADEHPSAQPLRNDTSNNETLLPDSSLGSNLTEEDIDLIDILWRQDIDIGVSKENFNSSSKSDKDKEADLFKSEEKSRKQTLPIEPNSAQTNINNEETSYVIDSETGELTPANHGSRLPDVQEDMEEEVDDQTPNSATIEISFDDVIDTLDTGINRPLTNPQSSNTENQLSYSRQVSLEGRWQDVQGFISNEVLDPPDNIVIKEEDDPMEVNSTNGELNVLLQDATLGTLDSQDNTFNLSQPVGMDNDLLPLNLNDSQPLFNTNSSDDVLSSLFPNATGMVPNTNFLQELMSNLNDDTEETELITIKTEDSDSAVGSMGSIGSASPLQDFGDSHSNLTSPFDGLEGATGGHEPTGQVVKYEPYDSGYTFSTIEWENENLYSNQSSSNDSADLGFTLANQDKINHDHSYPLKPGQEPREVKALQKEADRKISRSRDERKAKALKVPFSVDDIINSPVEKFNDMITKYKLSELQLQLIKDIRRRGKNKVAAQNCRKRKMEVIETLEESVIRMRQEKDHFLRQKIALERERNKIREKYSGLYRDLFRTLRDENGRTYNPNEYTLQHTPDGNVFLVPKSNSTGNEDPELKDMKKRKGRRK